MFDLHSQTGELFLNRDFQFIVDQSANLTICVKDSGIPSRTTCAKLYVTVKEEADLK
jgi:hypothetical protein